jgi:hypothetical protein
MFGAAPSSFPQGAAVPVFAGFSFPPGLRFRPLRLLLSSKALLSEFNSHGFSEQQSNSLHLTGVAGLLGDRINGNNYVPVVLLSAPFSHVTVSIETRHDVFQACTCRRTARKALQNPSLMRMPAPQASQPSMSIQLARGLFLTATPASLIGRTRRHLPLPSCSIVRLPSALAACSSTITFITIVFTHWCGRVWFISRGELSI